MLTQEQFEDLASRWVKLAPVFSSQGTEFSLFGSWNWQLKEAEENTFPRNQKFLALEFHDQVIDGFLQEKKEDNEDEILLNYQDTSCALDAAAEEHESKDKKSAGHFANTWHVNGWIHVLLHPIYQVPCPYLRLFYGGERALDISTLEEILRLNCGDEATKLQIQLIEEEHPYLGCPAACLHVCGLSERLSLLQSNPLQSAELSRGNSELYLLDWFALVGPYMGMKIPPRIYSDAAELLLKT